MVNYLYTNVELLVIVTMRGTAYMLLAKRRDILHMA